MTWPLELLDSVAERGSGHTPSQKHPEYWNGAVKWVSLADSSALDRGYIYNTAKRISALGLQNSSAVVHPAGTVILSRDAGVGKSAILGEEMAVSQHFIAWRCDGDKLWGEYLYQWLQLQKKEFERIAVGSTVKTIGLRYFTRLRVPLPPIEQQRRIAGILAAWDTAIERMERLVEVKEIARRALFRRLVTERSRQQSWRQVKLCDIAHRVRRQTDGAEYPLLMISSSSGFVRQEEKYRRYMAGESAKGYTLLRAGEFSYNKGNSKRYEFGCVFQLRAYRAALVPSVYVSFRLHDAVCSDYMRHVFEVDYLKPQLRAIANTGVRNNGLLNIRPTEFMGTKVPLPALDEQRRVSKPLGAAQLEVEILRRRLKAVRDQKRGLLQGLLTGEWHLRMPAAEPEGTDA